jgi:tetratricopeptide (TPR) repeat protein
MAFPYRWCDLGQSLADSGQIDQADYCFARAAELGPHVPPILMRVANFYFAAQRHDKALMYASRVLVEGSAYDSLVFHTYSRLGVELKSILEYGIPEDRRAVQSFFKYMVQSGSPAQVQQVWKWVAGHSFADDPLANQYIEYLLRRKLYEEAATAWSAYARERDADYPVANFLFNGDFEKPPTGCVLDWQMLGSSGFQAARDSNMAWSGKWSVRLHFTGKENVTYAGLAQAAHIRPGRYTFEAHVKTSGISTDEGIRFRVVDAEASRRLDILTEQALGTSDWREIRKDFTVGPATRLIEIQAVRRPSLKFDSQIGGTAWVDGLKIKPARP